MSIDIAVVPVAGLGTRLLPATKSQPKEMLPVGRTLNAAVLLAPGVAGNGQSELSQVIAGLRKCLQGEVTLNGEKVSNRDTRYGIDHGMSYVPEDRNHVGSSPNLSVTDNVIMKNYRKPPIGKGSMIDMNAATKFAQELKQAYDIIVPTVKTPVRLLSGGNLQRVILAREISGNPNFMVAVQPTRGLDVGADDYLVKPFAFPELLARIRALLRRPPLQTGNLLQMSDLEMDLTQREVRRAGRRIELSPREFSLLELLLRHPNQVLTRTQIVEHARGRERLLQDPRARLGHLLHLRPGVSARLPVSRNIDLELRWQTVYRFAVNCWLRVGSGTARSCIERPRLTQT